MQDDESNSASKDGSLMESLLSSFEIGLSWQSLEVHIKLERPERLSSKFSVQLEKILIKKIKQKSVSVIHSVVASLGSLQMFFQQIGDNHDRKLLSLTRVSKWGQPQISSEALQISVDLIKEKDDQKRMVVRGNIGSIQSVFTINACFDLMRLINKVIEFLARQMFVQQGLSYMLDGTSKQDYAYDREMDTGTDDLWEVSEDQFKSYRGNLNQSMFMSLNQSFQFAPTQSLCPTQPGEEHTKSNPAVADLQRDILNSSLDIDVSLQGVYLAFLKEPVFNTSELFGWVEKVEKNHKLDFHEMLCSYFFLRVDDITIGINPATSSKIISIGSLEVLDYECLVSESSSASKDLNSFSNRVVIEGIDVSSSSLDVSHNLEDSEMNFKSIISPSLITKYRERLLLSIDKLPKSSPELEKTASVLITIESLDPPSVKISVGMIRVDIDIESFKVMNNRKLFYEEITRIDQLLNAEKKKGQQDVFRHQEAMKYFGGCLTSDMRSILAEVEAIAKKLTTNEVYRERVLRLFELPNFMNLKREQCPKIVVDVTSINIKVGGALAEKSSESAWLYISVGTINLLYHQQIVLSWKNNIDISVQAINKSKMLFLSVIGDRVNLLAIDQGCMVIKISALELQFSPAILESLLLLSNVVDNRVTRTLFYNDKFQILKSLLEQQEKANRVYCIFEEETQVSNAMRTIGLAVNKGPELMNKIYFYLARLTIQFYDEQITKEIIESSITQRKRVIEDQDDWTFVDLDGSTSSMNSKVGKEVEALEARLHEKPVVLHLELKPIMVRVGLSPSSLMVLCHTILLRDGMTYLSSKDKREYQTQFVELMSINHDQPVFDAYLSKQSFDIKASVKGFKDISKRFHEQGPFLEIIKSEDLESTTGRVVDHTKITVSSIILRLGDHTSKEIFLCLIRLVDDTMLRFDRIAQTMASSREEVENEEIKMYRKKQEALVEKVKVEASKTKSTINEVSINLDSIYVDIFNPQNYRVVLKITATSFYMNDDVKKNKPMNLICKNIELYFAVSKEMTVVRSIEVITRKPDFFKVISLKALEFSMTEELNDSVPTQVIYINLPTDNGRNFFIMLDLESLGVLFQISKNLNTLLAAAKSKSEFLSQDLTERRAKNPKSREKYEYDEFEPVGLKTQEKDSIRNYLDEIMGKKEFQATLTPEQKLDVAISAIDDSYIEQIKSGRQSVVLRVWIDLIKINIYQNFDSEGHSYISLKLKETLLAARINKSQESMKKPTSKSFTTSSAVFSVNSLKVLDRTKGSMFKNLLKIEKHSLCLFARSREVAEQYLDSSLVVPKTIIESYMDKIAFIIDLKPIQINIDNRSVSSLKEFADKIVSMINSASPGDSPGKHLPATTDLNAEGKFLLDYISIGELSVELMARSSTNLSIANFVPDLNINLSEKFYEMDDPLNQTELTNKLLYDIKLDLNLVRLLNDNIKNLPLLANFVSLVDSLSSIYSAIADRDGRGVLMGIRDIGLQLLLTCVKTGQFGLKTIADLTKLLGRNAFGGLFEGWGDVNLHIEKLAARFKIGKTIELKESIDSGTSKKKK